MTFADRHAQVKEFGDNPLLQHTRLLLISVIHRAPP
jgi:hypothetical protein